MGCLSLCRSKMAIRRGGDEVSERERFERWWASEGVERLPGGTIEWAKDAAWLAWLAASPGAPTPKPENLKWENLKWLLDASNQVISS